MDGTKVGLNNMTNESSLIYRDLRYVRIEVDDLDAGSQFVTTGFGLQAADRGNDLAMFRSDARNYSLCLSKANLGNAVALTVATRAELDSLAERITKAGFEPKFLSDDAAAVRQAKSVVAVVSPNGVTVEIVWRPLTSGWRYHGPRDAGITGLQSVSLACTDIAVNERFWVGALGLRVTDWAGEATYLTIDEAHHRIALYPSKQDRILGASWAVEGRDPLMANWYFLQKSQMPVVAGPGRQPTSDAMFVTTRGPGDLLMTYSAGMDAGAHIARRGPRQFPNLASSHCAWGSPTTQEEFLGEKIL